MKVVVFGATGMVGRGVLRECLLAPDVSEVLVVGRSALAVSDPKLRELLLPDLFELGPIADQLVGFDACFFCLGVSSVGMREPEYRRITHDLTLSVARLLADRNPGMTFTHVSGQGTDSTQKGRTMWARLGVPRHRAPDVGTGPSRSALRHHDGAGRPRDARGRPREAGNPRPGQRRDQQARGRKRARGLIERRTPLVGRGHGR